MQIIQKKLLLLAFLLISCMTLLAQDNVKDNFLDVIHLKNGKIVKGIIVKHELGVLSIMLTDSITNKEKVQRYQQNDISKIIRRKETGNVLSKNDTTKVYVEGGEDRLRNTKKTTSQPLNSDMAYDLLPEDAQRDAILKPVPLPDKKMIQAPINMPGPTVTTGDMLAEPVDLVDLYKTPQPRRRYQNWYRQIRGFRVFLGYGYIQGVGKSKNNRIEFYTSLGFQFNPIFYMGIGTAYDITLNNKDASLPVFLNPRINFLDDYTTPFLDVKAGYSVMEGRGFYFSSTLGISLTKKGRRAFNLGLSYSRQNAKFYEWSKSTPKERVAVRPTYHGIALNFSYEFGVGR